MCDSLDHLRRDCVSFQEALQNNKVFFREGRIYSTGSHLPLVPNWGKGGMKKIMDDANVGRDTTMYHSATTGIQVLDNHEEPLFWTNVLKYASQVKEEDI